MAVRHFPSTIIMLALNAVPVVCILLGSMTMALATPLYVVFGFALTARINAIFLNRIFRKYIPEEKEDDLEDAWENEAAEVTENVDQIRA